jgi:hypothetical protein
MEPTKVLDGVVVSSDPPGFVVAMEVHTDASAPRPRWCVVCGALIAGRALPTHRGRCEP